jgi:hypothetical protein
LDTWGINQTNTHVCLHTVLSLSKEGSKRMKDL